MADLPPEDALDHEDGLGTLLFRIIDDAKGLARAELDLLKARLGLRFAGARAGLMLGVIALLLAHLALIGLVVGLVMTLATVLGPGAATAIVVGIMLAVAALLGWLAYARLKRAFAPEVPGEQ